MLLMIDNYDSFTFNLVQYLQVLGAEVRVERNDALTVEQIGKLAPERIVISPGPCTPNEAGVSLEVIRRFGPTTPILGVCLGHQSIGQAYGGRVVRAGRIMHGKTSRIRHHGRGVFAGLPDGFEATRYHSLVVEKDSLPECLEVTAWTEHEDGSFEEIMGLRHREHPVEGVQFHPESILTEHGHALLRNFLARTASAQGAEPAAWSVRAKDARRGGLPKSVHGVHNARPFDDAAPLRAREGRREGRALGCCSPWEAGYNGRLPRPERLDVSGRSGAGGIS